MESGLPLTHVEHGRRIEPTDKTLTIKYAEASNHVVNQYRKGEIPLL
jgi:hypothetical protein